MTTPSPTTPTLLEADALLIDLDNTLVDSSEAVHACWTAWCTKRNVDPADVFAISEGRQAWSVIAELRPDLDAHAEDQWLIDLQVNDLESTRPLPGAIAFTKALDPVRWAVVTSGPHRLAERRLRAAGIMPPPVLIGADDVTQSKPHPEGFLLAAERLGVTPDRCVVFEDSPAGLEAARRAHMRSVAITGVARNRPPASQLAIENWTQIRPDGRGRWLLTPSNP